jgi:hypothetical protein
MAWIWWLLAPVTVTVAGACVLWWAGQREARSASWPGGDSIQAYRSLLDALPQGRPNEPAPVNLIVLPAPRQQPGVPGS